MPLVREKSSVTESAPLLKIMNRDQKKHTISVLEEVGNERLRQHSKFGEQNCPSLNKDILNGFNSTVTRMAEEYQIPLASDYQSRVNHAMKTGKLTYADILIEEVCEVIECMSDEDKMRSELIQVAAVSVQWIEAIDRRKALKKYEDSQRGQRQSQ